MSVCLWIFVLVQCQRVKTGKLKLKQWDFGLLILYKHLNGPILLGSWILKKFKEIRNFNKNVFGSLLGCPGIIKIFISLRFWQPILLSFVTVEFHFQTELQMPFAKNIFQNITWIKNIHIYSLNTVIWKLLHNDNILRKTNWTILSLRKHRFWWSLREQLILSDTCFLLAYAIMCGVYGLQEFIFRN